MRDYGQKLSGTIFFSMGIEQVPMFLYIYIIIIPHITQFIMLMQDKKLIFLF